jgi:threonine dehydratase
MSGDEQIGVDRIEAAQATIAGAAGRTPALHLAAIDERCGGPVRLKAENLQRTGSFKIRGATNKLAVLGERARAGVVTGSAGNHGQALAAAAQRAGTSCDLFVPTDGSVSKVEAAERLGARIHTSEGTVDECVQAAIQLAEEDKLTFVHPFDDLEVIAGQGTIGLELLEDIDDLAKVLVPLGGGGLAAGIAIAVKSRRSEVEVIGVQVEACAPFPESLASDQPVAVPSARTIADGIAVKRPGAVTLPLLKEWLDGVAIVTDDQVADAMGALMADGKLVVEGAGAVGVAALLSGREAIAKKGTTAVILSGGNLDPAMLEAVARRAVGSSGHAVVLYTRISDRPGSLAALLEVVAKAGASVIDVRHLREGIQLHIAETGVEMILETRGHDHAESIVGALAEKGYEVSKPWAPV